MSRNKQNNSAPVVALMLLTSIAYVHATAAPPANSAAKKRAQLEKKFTDQLTKSVLTGQFSVDGKPAGDVPRTERYEIESLQKTKSGRWVITSRIQYGKHDVKVPIMLDVFWAGDTPVISLTDVTIPGMGTFTARVMFYGDRYAGTWQHGKVGGHLWGKVGKQESSKPSPAKSN